MSESTRRRLERIERIHRVYEHKHRGLRQKVQKHKDTLACTKRDLKRLQQRMKAPEYTMGQELHSGGYLRVLGRRRQALADRTHRLRELRDTTAAALMEDRRRMTATAQTCRVLRRMKQETKSDLRRRRNRATLAAISERAHRHHGRKEDTHVCRGPGTTA